jgi:hypothetical protein
MNTQIFKKLIEQMDHEGADCSAPQGFQAYCDEIGLIRERDSARTAACISIDFQENLRRELRENNMMVFRLGVPHGQRNTHFGLARIKHSWEDYFLFDEANTPGQDFHLSAKKKEALQVFQLIPKITEKSVVNFIVASGVLHYFLKLDDSTEQLTPATCQSTFSFRFKPHQEIQATWEHRRGQIEIDSLFFAKKSGITQMFLIEAKHNISQATIAKHKLVYPALALRQELSRSNIPVTPIYLKTAIRGRDLLIDITLCDFPRSSNAVSDLTATRREHFLIKEFRL